MWHFLGPAVWRGWLIISVKHPARWYGYLKASLEGRGVSVGELVSYSPLLANGINPLGTTYNEKYVLK